MKYQSKLGEIVRLNFRSTSLAASCAKSAATLRDDGVPIWCLDAGLF
jgi:hypothetical protein